MICKKCGKTIDIQRKQLDGSLQCPYCRTIYRPRVDKENNTLQTITTQKKTKKKKRFLNFVVLFG